MAKITVRRFTLWNAIDRYVKACGGDTSAKTIGPARTDAEIEVQHAVEDLTRLPLSVLRPLKRFERAMDYFMGKSNDAKDYAQRTDVAYTLAQAMLRHFRRHKP